MQLTVLDELPQGITTMTNGPVLVAGAAGGGQGSTGRSVAHLLLDRGVPVRAFVRSDDERAEALRSHGAEVVVGDLRDIASVGPALSGVRRAFFTYPVRAGHLEAVAVFAAAAREKHLDQVVAVSQLVPHPDAASPRLREHWVAEQILDAAGVGAVHLRAPLFFENIRSFIASGGDGDELAVPLADLDTVLPRVAGHDVARVAAGILASPSRHDPGFRLVVGELGTVGDLVADFERALGRPLRFVEISDEAFHRDTLARGRAEEAAIHLTRLWSIFRLIAESGQAWTFPPYQVTDLIERVGGQPPQTFEAFLSAQRDSLVGSGSR
jgi:uncharacterized protein YbjT (DUF2867 family)